MLCRSAFLHSVRIAALSLAAAWPLAANAQKAPDDESREAQVSASEAEQEIVVTGTGLPVTPGTPAYGSVVIGRERLTHNSSGRLERILGDVAGLQQYRRSDSRSANPTGQGITLRALGGNATSRALVLLDAVPQADPFFGYIPYNALVPGRLSSIRITRGGGSGPFGAGAVAGTIELTSATRADLPQYGASLLYGSRDSLMASASYSPNVGNGFVSISGNYDRSDGFYTVPDNTRGPADARAAYENWSTSLRAVMPVDALTEIQFRALVYRDTRSLRFSGADSSTKANDASIRLVHRGDWQVDALLYLQARNFSNRILSSQSQKLVLDQRNTPSTGLGGKLELRPPVGDDHVLRVGADFRRATGELFEEPYSTQTGLATERRNAGGNTTTFGVFAEDDWTLGNLVLTGGARLDLWLIEDGFYNVASPIGAVIEENSFPNRSGAELTGRIGALLHASRMIDLRAAAYTGFRLPTLNELYRPFVIFPVVTQANAALKPERVHGIEAGLDLRPAEGLQFSVTGFYNKLENAVANVTLGPLLRQRRNVDAIVAAGIELTAMGRVGDFDLTASYAYNHSTVEGSRASAALDGFDPAQSPRHVASGTIAFSPEAGPRLSASLRYIGEQFEDDRETAVLPGALTMDLAASLPLASGLELVGRAENLFDETIVTRIRGNNVDLGTPRTLWVGLRFTG